MNESFSVNVEQIRDKHRNRCNNRIKIYEKLLEKCYYRLNTSAGNDDTYCLYPIPDFILGMPTYNLAYCAAYIIYNLKSNGFTAKFFNPNIIFVSWNFDQPYYVNNNKKTIAYQNSKLLMPPSSNTSKIIEVPKPKKTYRSITDYKPTGNFIHN